MAAVTPLSLSPSCQEEGCHRHHWVLGNGRRLHEGLHLFIKGWDTFEACHTKVSALGQEAILWPQGATYEMPGALDLRIIVLKERRSPRYFDYATEKFPEVVAKLRVEDGIEEYVPSLLRDAESILEMEDGI